MIGRFANPGTYKELFDFKEVFRVILGGVLALAGYLLSNETHPLMSHGLILASVCINGIPIVWGALSGIIKKQINVDELVSLAIIASLFAGEFLSAAVVSFVMVVGSLIEEATGESARRAIRALVKITPKEATRVTGSTERKIPISEIKVDDLLLVKPGERIPVDGIIIDGMSAVDEAAITGEPIPVEKTAPDPVYAGTLNQNGVITMKTTQVGEDSTLGKVIRLVSEAEAHHPETVALIDRYAKWFTPGILLCAAIAWVVTGDLNRAVTVLIVGCPCALILAAPTAIVATISRAARSGILIKGGKYIELAADAKTILFDKTGTLTEGNPRVDIVIPADGLDEAYVLRQAACVEQNSTHPLARAVLKAAHYARVVVRAAENLITEIGRGVKGCVEGCTIEVGNVSMGNATAALPRTLAVCLDDIKGRGATPLVVFRDADPIGIIGVSDHIRPAAADTLGSLKALGLGTIGILSGDHRQSVQRVAKRVGATHIWSNLAPQDKLKVLEELRVAKPDRKIVFVGDGINDAPALAAADVGIAMGAKGTEVALETADIALMNDDLSKLPFLVKIGRRMVRTIKWNIAFGLIFNLIAVLASGGGYLTPIMGALVHNIGSVIVVMFSASIAFERNEVIKTG